MMEHPFHPMLYANPLLPYSEEMWIGNQTWLHKPPFLNELQSNKKFRALLFVIAAVLIFMIYDSESIERFHTNRNYKNICRPARIENRKQFEKADATLPSKDIVIFNCGGYLSGVACMFYTGKTSYNQVVAEKNFKKLKSRGIKIKVFDDIPLPEYLAANTSGTN